MKESATFLSLSAQLEDIRGIYTFSIEGIRRIDSGTLTIAGERGDYYGLLEMSGSRTRQFAVGFVEEQKELADATGALSEFLEDVALATDLDTDTSNEDRVSLMTVHLAKGLEFPYVYIVGMEEELFPSGMSMNTRSELEEERRLFYVAVTRAEKQAYLTYTQSRYRWGKLIDAEPSRFIEEIDDQYLEYLTPITEHRFKPLIDADIFGEVDKSKLRLRKPVASSPPKGPTKDQLEKLRRLKPVSRATANTGQHLSDSDVKVGSWVEHIKFGKGEVLKLEGVGGDTKAEIRFEHGGLKKLLLRFAKLTLLSS